MSTFGVSPTTVVGWLKKEAELDLEDTLVRGGGAECSEDSEEDDKVLELDELWSFVRRKREKVWVWLALRRETRQVVAFVTGDRSRATCERLWRAIPEQTRPRMAQRWAAVGLGRNDARS